jgi:hypothetical protein
LQPILSFIATLVVLGVAFSLLHWLILALGLSDLAALMLFAVPIAGYLSYATQETMEARIRFAVRIYLVFAAVTLSAAGIVWYIG